jgi:putative iron-regulated protein
MKRITFIIFVLITISIFTSCKKTPEAAPTSSAPSTNLNAEILSDFSSNIAQATYKDLSAKADQLYASVQKFDTITNDVNLTECKQLWRDTRAVWEQSEGFLFGPVATNNIDPRIDTWPVDYVALDSLMNSSVLFSESYVNTLDDALRGFHPIEYLLFGNGGNKAAAQFTAREKAYLIALSVNLKNLISQLWISWDPALSGNYGVNITGAGNGTSVYSSKRAVYEEIVNSMIGICDEVANGKIEEPFATQNPLLEESPFSYNSITDFTNNIKSVQNVYMGKYLVDGKGIEDIVRANNLSLDANIKNKINAAIAALNNITVPFGQAIISQPIQITNAQNAINDLKTTLENDLLPFIKTTVN